MTTKFIFVVICVQNVRSLNTDLIAIGATTRQQLTTSFKIAPSAWREILGIDLGPGIYLIISSAMFQNKIASSVAKSITIRSNVNQNIRDSVFITPGNFYSSCITDSFGTYNNVTYKVEAWTESPDIEVADCIITAVKLREV